MTRATEPRRAQAPARRVAGETHRESVSPADTLRRFDAEFGPGAAMREIVGGLACIAALFVCAVGLAVLA